MFGAIPFGVISAASCLSGALIVADNHKNGGIFQLSPMGIGRQSKKGNKELDCIKWDILLGFIVEEDELKS